MLPLLSPNVHHLGVDVSSYGSHTCADADVAQKRTFDCEVLVKGVSITPP